MDLHTLSWPVPAETLILLIAVCLCKRDRIALASTCSSNGNILQLICSLFQCYVCDARLLYSNFPMKARVISVEQHSRRRRCYSCGVKAEAENINRRRVHHTHDKCISCCEKLSLNPPPYNYLKNHRSRRHSLRCGRCLRGLAPNWSVQLQRVCRSWKSLAGSGTETCKSEPDKRDGSLSSSQTRRVLFIVIQNLALSTKYRVPWSHDSGLHKIALFLGRRFSQKHNWNGVMSCISDFSRHFSLPKRQMKWKLDTNNKLIERVCCSPSWLGWYCHTCCRQY